MINQQISYYCTDVRDSSAVLDSFFVTREFENIGKLRGLEKKIEEHDYTAAESLRNQIIAENIIEQASKEVLSLYLKNEQGLFDANDSLDLLMWATSCYNLFGKAVPMAQILYNAMHNTSIMFEEDCPASLPRSASLQHKNEIELELYPNPNSDVLYIHSNEEAVTEATVVIKDLEGKLIFQGKINFEKGLELRNISLSHGVYLVELSFEFENILQIQHKKLVYLK